MLEFITKNLNLVLLAIVIWTIPWKGFALWKSARRGDKAWFVVLLVINTLAILEILYIFFFSERKAGTSSQNDGSNRQF